jgi:hypothetical protein
VSLTVRMKQRTDAGEPALCSATDTRRLCVKDQIDGHEGREGHEERSGSFQLALRDLRALMLFE